jgi:hypothetical protein
MTAEVELSQETVRKFSDRDSGRGSIGESREVGNMRAESKHQMMAGIQGFSDSWGDLTCPPNIGQEIWGLCKIGL